MKTLITLNIGLLDTDGQAVNIHTAIFHLLSILKIDILASRVGKGKWEGSSEPVLVVSSHVIFDETFENKLVELAQSLRQSCVAVRFLDGTGRLYPAVYPFDNSQFVELEKQRAWFLVECSNIGENDWFPAHGSPARFRKKEDAEFFIQQLRRDAEHGGYEQDYRLVELEKRHEKVLIEFSYDQEKWKPIFNNPTLFKNRRDAEFEIEQLRRDAAQSQHRKAFYRIVQIKN